MTQPVNDQPVAVHVASIEAGVQLGPAPASGRRHVRTGFMTETVDDTNPVRPLLPASPDRVSAQVQVTGGDIYLCDSEAKALQAADVAGSHQGSILPSANTGPWPLHGENAVWIAQVTATKTCVVSVTADYAVTS